MRDRNQRYLELLKKNQQLWQAAAKIEKDSPAKNAVERVMAQVGGPVIYLYVSWVIQNAMDKNIKRLYFLARDGQIFYEVAKIICKYGNLDLECRYLYCSRLAWRVPCYWLTGEKCLDQICQRSMNLTIKKIFDRTLLSEEKSRAIAEKLGFSNADMLRILDHGETESIKEKLRMSPFFMQAVFEKSREEFEKANKYLLQEGLQEGVKFAIVDTGWVGSMQRNLRELLEYQNQNQVQIEGFYFGMFRQPETDSQFYHTYLFSGKKGLWRKATFNNNLLECMCGATDGMTIGYEEKDGLFQPRFANSENINSGRWDVKENHRIVCRFAEAVSSEYGFLKIPHEESKKISSCLMKAFMMTPTKAEAESFGKYLFSDDMTENGLLELAPYLTQRELFGEDFIPKVWKRLFVRNTKKRQTKSYWIEGSISRNGSWLAPWHRMNGLIWHLLQFGLYN